MTVADAVAVAVAETCVWYLDNFAYCGKHAVQLSNGVGDSGLTVTSKCWRRRRRRRRQKK